jgi:hypothetical protein
MSDALAARRLHDLSRLTGYGDDPTRIVSLTRGGSGGDERAVRLALLILSWPAVACSNSANEAVLASMQALDEYDRG